jgi:dTMP kinase
LAQNGVFISLDGVDGAGKSTQCRLLAEWLQARGHKVALCRDPGGTPMGDRIRGLLLDSQTDRTPWCEALLFMASRAQLLNEVIRPALDRGEVVISDRYLLANVVYQGHAGGLPPEQLWEVGRTAAVGVLPDLTLVLDVAPEIAKPRKQGPPDQMERRGLEFQAKVRAGFLAEATKDRAKIKVIDAGRSVEEVQQAIQREVAHVLGSRERP